MRPPRPALHRRALLRGLRPGPTQARRPPQPDADPGDLLRASRPAMGSFFEVRLPARAPGAIDLANRALDLIDALEDQLTIYRDTSEVSRLNATAHLGPVPVEPGLFRLLEFALRVGRETAGAYDVASGALSLAWGFIRGPRQVPEPAALADARARSGQHHLTLDPSTRSVAFDRPGVVVNLGSIGKGFAVDRAACLIRDYWWPIGALIHGGQSSAYALGSPPGRFAGRWEIAVPNPFRPGARVGILKVRNRAVGTSGGAFQSFESGGRRYGHILDPRTGEPPAAGPAAVTVLAPTAAEADALSTAFYLLGPAGAEPYTRRNPNVGAIFIDEGPAPDEPRLTVLNLAEADFLVENQTNPISI